MLKKKYYLFFIVTLYAFCMMQFPVWAQKDSIEYFKSYEKPNMGMFYAGTFSRYIHIKTQSSDIREKSIKFSPNSSAFAGINLQYKKYFIYLEAGLPNTYKVSPKETNVRGYAIFLSRFKKKWGVTGFVSYNKGLLMESTGNRPYADRNDMRRFSIGVHYYRIFNSEKFSYVAPNAGSNQQIRSAGSFILMTTPAFQKLQSNSSIIPSEIAKYHFTQSGAAIESMQLYSLQIKPGYAYNFIWGKGQYFFSPAVYAGIGTDYHILKTNNNIQGINLNMGYRMKFITGINNDLFYITLECLLESNRGFVYNSRISNTYREGSINFGVRF